MQAQDYMNKLDFVITSPASGSKASGGVILPRMRTRKLETNWLAMGVEAAMANQEALKSATGDGNTSPQISVLNVVQLQTRGMLKTKHLMPSKTICSLARCRGRSSSCTH